ncbi:MAG: branched-chain amino acid ABC transporter permease [Rubellimicrobium sp.]|nr:branched-chain amino acid ABC transporter permease [Rubellimicrobium sp.]
MTLPIRNLVLFGLMALLILITGVVQGWTLALTIVNMGLISAIMALGVNLQWGFAGLFNVGVMGFVALGALGAVLVSMPPTTAAWEAGGVRVLLGLAMGAATIVAAVQVHKRMAPGRTRTIVIIAVLVVGFFLYRAVFDPGAAAVEAVNPTLTGYLGGLGLPVILSWPVGGLLAAGAGWVIGKTALGLRSDYLAIATLGIAEIIIAVLKHEEWMSRGVRNVSGIPRPVPLEVDLQRDPDFLERAASLGLDPIFASTLTVRLAYMALFAIVLLVLLWLAQKALNSPWGRMMRAIRDNEVAAEAMGKDVKGRHLQIFILGSAICGMAGAMMATLEGQLTPSSYLPLRFTFLVWVMVIVGGSGNNFGAVLGGMLIWWLWVMVEPIGLWLMTVITAGMPDGSWLKLHLTDAAAHMRLFTMGMILLLVLRFSPRGLIPEK